MNYYIDVDKFQDMNSDSYYDSIYDSVSNVSNKYISSMYGQKATIAVLLLGMLCVACFVFAFIFVKKARGLCITAAAFQFVGLFASARAAVAFFKAGIGASTIYYSYDFIELFFGSGLWYVFWNMLILASHIISLIYFIKIINVHKIAKAFVIPAIVVTGIKVFLSPVRLVKMYEAIRYSKNLFTVQRSWDGTYRFLFILPALCLVGVAVFAMIDVIKGNNEPAIEAVDAPVAESAPTVEYIPVAQPAPVVEPAPVAQPAPATTSNELKQYKELLDMGIITQEEFDAKKKQLLDL